MTLSDGHCQLIQLSKGIVRSAQWPAACLTKRTHSSPPHAGTSPTSCARLSTAARSDASQALSTINPSRYWQAHPRTVPFVYRKSHQTATRSLWPSKLVCGTMQRHSIGYGQIGLSISWSLVSESLSNATKSLSSNLATSKMLLWNLR